MGEKCKVSSFSDLGSKRRRSVETVYVTSLPDKSNGTLILLADGFDNDINSNLISKLVCENFISQYSALELQKPTKEALEDIFYSLQEFVLHKGTFFSSPDLKTAFMAILVWDNRLLIGHVGNISSFYLKKGSDAELTRLTKLRRNQPIEEVPALGMKGELDLEIFDMTPSLGDKLFILTDGITNVMPEEEILTYIRKYPNASFPKTIVNHANELETEGNTSAVTVEFGASAPVSVPIEPKKPKPIPVKKEKPFPTPKLKSTTTQKNRLSVWFIGWVLLILLVAMVLWQGYPKLQSWVSSLSSKETPVPITQVPPVEQPIKQPVLKDIEVLFQVNPTNAWIQVVLGKLDHITDTDIRLYESHGETNKVILKAGEYTVYAQLDGYIPQISHFTLSEDKLNNTVAITLDKKPTPPPVTKPNPIKPTPPPVKPPVVIPKPPIQPTPPPVVKEWSIAVTSQPTGAKIYINNQFLGMFTPATLKFKPGTYLVTVSKAGYKDVSRTVVFTTTAPTFKTIHFALEKHTAYLPGHLLCFYLTSGEAI
ncbi:PEGA domain-containing protein [bacterium]|nr:PEGA domain-containing protein [bacterium]